MQPEIAITDRISENCHNFINININPQNIELLDLDSFHRLLAVVAQRPQNLEFNAREERRKRGSQEIKSGGLLSEGE
jgi:hypothetical protein